MFNCLRLTFHRSILQQVRHKHYNVVVAGGGLVGTSFSAAVGCRLPAVSVRLLERDDLPEPIGGAERWQRDRRPYSNRVSALSLDSLKFLESFGARQLIEERRSCVVRKMLVWESCSQSFITFEPPPSGTPSEDALAFIVENDLIVSSCYECLRQSDNVEISANSFIKRIDFPSEDSSDCTRINLSTGEQISCDLLVGADGHQSFVRKSAGFDSFHWDYKQMGLVATLAVESSGQSMDPISEIVELFSNPGAIQRFLPSGPVALLPLDSQHCSLIWTLDKPSADRLKSCPEEKFIDELNTSLHTDENQDGLANSVLRTTELILSMLPDALRSVESRRSRFSRLVPTVNGVLPLSRAAFPFALTHSNRYVRKGLALIGDAAHRIHPLAGQGLNLGFGDAATLCDSLVDSQNCGEQIIERDRLLDYETSRLRTVLPVVATVHGLQALYSTSWSPIVGLRAAGLQAVNSLAPFKDFIIHRATGL